MCNLTPKVSHKEHKFHPKRNVDLGPVKVTGKKLPDKKTKLNAWSKM